MFSCEANFTAVAGSKFTEGAAAILNKPKPITPPITHVTYANLSRISWNDLPKGYKRTS